MAFSPDRQRLATGSHSLVTIWDVSALHGDYDSRVAHSRLGRPYKGDVNDAAMSPDGKTMALTHFSKGAANRRSGEVLQFWDLAQLAWIGPELIGHDDYVTALAYNPDGTLVASGARDGRVVLWDARAHKQIRSLTAGGDYIAGLTFSPNNRLVAARSAREVAMTSPGAPHSIKVWELSPKSSGEPESRFDS